MDITFLDIYEELKEYGEYIFFFFISYGILIIPLGIWTILKFRKKEYYSAKLNKGVLALAISCIIIYGAQDAYKRMFSSKHGGWGENILY